VENLPVLIAGTLAVAAGLLVVLYVALRSRLGSAEAALDRGDIARARSLTAPLLAMFPTVSFVASGAAEVLYASGDPLSAASLWEKAMKRLGPREIAPRLVAAYAALNRAADARRVAALAETEPRTRLALAWSELVALGGDRTSGRALADAPSGASSSPSERAMAQLLVAIAHADDRVRSDAALAEADAATRDVRPIDRAFLEYLEGVARRERGERDLAIATFERAMATLPDSIGAALARRERSHLVTGG